MAKKAKAEYQGEDLQRLSDLQHVRERPSMYIGDTTARGLHHLVYEVVDNSIDEAMAGFASKIQVTINSDGSVTVQDDGRGIPVDIHQQLSEQEEREISTLEGVMTFLKFGGNLKKALIRRLVACMASASRSSIFCRSGVKSKSIGMVWFISKSTSEEFQLDR
jgi:DNA gyrase subunit B